MKRLVSSFKKPGGVFCLVALTAVFLNFAPIDVNTTMSSNATELTCSAPTAIAVISTNIVSALTTIVASTNIGPTTAQAGILTPLACGTAEFFGYLKIGWNNLCLTAMYIENNWGDPMGDPWYGR